MSGQFAEAERLAAAAREIAAAAGQDAAERVWTTNREGRLRAAEQHEEMLRVRTRGPALEVALSTWRSAWQALGTALMHARLEQGARGARLPGPAARVVSLVRRQPVSAVLRRRSHRDRRPARAGGASSTRCITPMRDRYVMLGLSYMAWEGPWARVIGLLAAYLERWDEATAAFEDAIARCRRLGARPYLARTEYEFGRALLARGRPADVERARALIASARERGGGAGDGGARAARGRAARRLGAGAGAQLGARARRAPAADRDRGTGARDRTFSFTREGEYWTVAHAGATFRLKDSAGAALPGAPARGAGREIHVLDLVGERAGGGGGGTRGHRHRRRGRAAGRRSAPQLPAAASRTWKRRSPRPSRSATPARGRRGARRDRGAGAELGRAVGLGGRARRAGGAAERARSAVQRRIKNAIERIGEHAPELAALLARTIRTGNFCEYRPERGG